MDLRVCGRIWAPFLTSYWTGYDVDILNAALSWLGSNLTYKKSYIPSFNKTSDECDIIIGHIPVVSGSAYSYTPTTFRGGVQLVIPAKNTVVSWWDFITVFEWKLWMMIGITALLLTPLFWWLEVDYYKRKMGKIKFPTDPTVGLIESTYRTYGKILNVTDEMRVKSVPAKIIAITWGMTTMILSSIYTARLTSNAVMQNFASNINSVWDVSNLNVGTANDAVQQFMRYSFIGVGVGPYERQEDGITIYDSLFSSNIDAIMIDTSWIRHHLQGSCSESIIVGDIVQYQNLAFALSRKLDPSFVYNMTVSILNLSAMAFILDRESEYFPKQSPTCTKFIKNPQLTLSNFAGMWVVVAGFIGLAFILLILPKIHKNLDVDMFSVRKKNSSLTLSNGVERSDNSVVSVASSQ
jgi:hypothetical protein